MASETRARRIRKLVEECRAVGETAAGARSWEEEFETSVQDFAVATILKIDLLEKCTLCRKFVMSGHLQSGRHRQALRESSTLDFFAGLVEGIRALGKLTRTGLEVAIIGRLCRDLWGSRLDHLPERAKDKISSVGHLTDPPMRPQFFTSDMVFELGMATYCGSGKYTDDDVVLF